MDLHALTKYSVLVAVFPECCVKDFAALYRDCYGGRLGHCARPLSSFWLSGRVEVIVADAVSQGGRKFTRHGLFAAVHQEDETQTWHTSP